LEDAVLTRGVLQPVVYVVYYDSSIVTTWVFCHKGTKALRLNNYFIFFLSFRQADNGDKIKPIISLCLCPLVAELFLSVFNHKSSIFNFSRPVIISETSKTASRWCFTLSRTRFMDTLRESSRSIEVIPVS